MQDQEPGKEKKTGLKDRIWGGIALLLLAVGVICFYCQFNKLPRAEWRDASTPLAWEVDGLCIEEAEAFWKSSAGDARMELRSYNFPVCRLKLGDSPGKGQVVVRFMNGEGIQMGDRVYIPYADGKFIPRENNSMKVTEQEAHVRLEDGFLSRDEYTLHQMDQNAPLWRVMVECRPEGGNLIEIGQLSPVPNDL